MGIHADAVAMAAKTGRTVAECKKARVAKDAEISKALAGADPFLGSPADVMVKVCFPSVPARPSQVQKQDDSQVQPAQVAKQVDDSIGAAFVSSTRTAKKAPPKNAM